MWFFKAQGEEIFFEKMSKEFNNPELRNFKVIWNQIY